MKEKIILTKHQNDVLNKALYILSTRNRLIITGKAGTGKTTLVDALLKELKIRESGAYSYKKSICSAPTNKAVKVLKDKIDFKIKNNYFKTTHSALRLKRVINEKDGSVKFSADKSSDEAMKGVTLLIIDEASMLNTELLGFIEKLPKTIKVIFIGDEAQLPPVGEEVSPVFRSDYPKLELTEIIRQGEGNPIIELSRDFTLLGTKTDNRNEVGGYIFSDELGKVISTLAAVNGSDDLKFLAWTNREVDYINYLVRKRIYGNPNKVELGESLVFNSPYDVYFTNDEVYVEKLQIIEQTYTLYKFPNTNYNAENLDEPEYIARRETLKLYKINDKILVIHEDSEALYKEILKDLRARAKASLISWKTGFYGFTENFADIKYNHAITVHKSQGSTYKQTIINIKDLSYNKDINEYNKLLYTAITRAKELVVLYKA